MANENADKDHDTGPENKLRHNFRLGDVTWVKSKGSWWPAQVIDESCVGSKPKKKDKYDCLVRLYGTCEYLYVDPWKSNSEFEMMLKQGNKSEMEAFREVLEKELSGVNSCSDYEDGNEEEAVNSKGGDTKRTSKKDSSRKARKQDYSDSSAEGLRNKRQKNAGQSASGRSEGATQGSKLGDPAEHNKIKAVVRDILFKDIIDKEHDSEMAFVDEVINGICNATDGMIGSGDASTKGGRGIKQSGSGVEGESSNAPGNSTDDTGAT